MIPPDSDAWLAVRPVSKVSAGLAPLVQRVPELAGVFDMVRSVSGVNLVQPDGDSGFDPGRGIIVASWRKGMLFLLPVDSQRTVERRLPLKLARLGFVETVGDAPVAPGVRAFESAERGPACMMVKDGVAVLFVGKVEVCPALVDLLKPVEKDDDSTLQPPLAAVEAELGMADSDVAFKVGGSLFAPEVLAAAGLPIRGPAAYVARGFLGDLRGAISFDRGVVFRVAAGADGAPFSPLPAVVHGAGPVSVDVTVGPSVRPVVDTAINLADRKVRGLEALASTWNGSSRLVFDASVVPGDPAVESQRGLGMLSAILGRFGMRAAFGVRGSDPDASVRQMQRWGTPVSATPDPVVAASAGTPVGTSQPPVAPVAVVPVYVAPVAVFRVGGLNFRAVSAGSAVLLAGGVQRFEVGSPDPASPGLPDVVDGPRVVSLHVDPEGLLKASGYSSIDYLKHIVDPLAGVDLDLYFEAGRFLADGRVRVR